MPSLSLSVGACGVLRAVDYDEEGNEVVHPFRVDMHGNFLSSSWARLSTNSFSSAFIQFHA